MSFEPDDAAPNDVIDQAIAWHLRRDEMGDADWQAFILWLEISPAYASAYDAIALQDSAPGKPETFTVANDNPPRRWWAIGTGLTVIAAMIVGFAIMPRSDPYAIVTKPGEQREVALGDGTRIELNGATRLTLDHHDLRVATLERGEATFHVRHDAGVPFTLTASGRTIEDAGTVFNVTSDGPRLDVQVAEGAVVFEPGKEAVRLTAGGALTVNEDSHTIALSRVTADSVGGWRRGVLSYSNVPLSVVRDAVERRYRSDMTLSGDLSARSFTGMVRLTGNEARDIPHLAALIGANSRYDGTRWILSSKDNDAR
jgi:transmembrane sensor